MNITRHFSLRLLLGIVILLLLPSTHSTLNAQLLEIKNNSVDYLTNNLSSRSINTTDITFLEQRSNIDKLGLGHARFRIMYKGLLVYGREVIVNLNRDFNVAHARGELQYDEYENLDLKPLISKESALEIVKLDLGDSSMIFGEGIELIIFDGRKFNSDRYGISLAWKIDMIGSEKPGYWTYILDAHTTNNLLTFDNVEYAKSRTIYDGSECDNDWDECIFTELNILI